MSGYEGLGSRRSISLEKGLVHDKEALADWQEEYVKKLAINMKMEDEAYLSQHPEIGALLKAYIKKITRHNTKVTPTTAINHCAKFFSRHEYVLDMVARKVLDLPPDVPYVKKRQTPYFCDKPVFNITSKPRKHDDLQMDDYISTSENTINTMSSSFLSVYTTDTTKSIREPSPLPEPTFSETMFELISNTVDKAFYMKFDEYDIKYDTAYNAVKAAVDNAMEITVVEIKEDIVDLINAAWLLFEGYIVANEEAAAHVLWEKRMRMKTFNKTLRKSINFKGYETPPSSTESSSEEGLVEIPRLCRCFPRYLYNRYPKDRFGCYLPQSSTCRFNVTQLKKTESFTSRKSVSFVSPDSENKIA